MFRQLINSLVLLLFLGNGFSQSPQDTVLPVVEVKGQLLRSDFVGDRSRQWGKEALVQSGNQQLSTLLEQESGIFIKSYGGGGAATTSVRGGSAGHTNVLWNGLPLQSPMLGLLDLSLMPLAFVDEVGLSYGGNTAAWGSGTIGGLISLRNRAPEAGQSALSIFTTVGSFGLYDRQFKAQYVKEKWKVVSRLFHRQADNDFTYQIRPDLPEKRQEHAAYTQYGLLQELYYQPSPRQQFALYLWAQQSDQEIPPTIVQNRSEATQNDRFLRGSLQWKLVQDRMVWQVKTALFREHLDYQDPQILLDSPSSFWLAMTEVENDWQLNAQQRLQFGISHSWMQARIDAYEAPPRQHRTAFFAAFRQQAGQWQLQLNMRQELVDGKRIPLVPSLGVQWAANSWLSLKGRLSRNYRLPTFNDLYWRPGGNPDLLPESGWSEELTAAFNFGQGRWGYSLTAFNRKIDNWILWSIADGQNFWSPRNLSEVWSRGLEQRFFWKYRKGDWQGGLKAGYDFIRSTNEVALSSPKIAEGEQLIYVPRHQAFGSLELQWKQLKLTYRHTYTGAVGSVSEGQLEDYQLGYCSFAYAHRWRWGNIQLFFHLNNLWDASYQVVERRLMPGRHYKLGLRFEFKKEKNSKNINQIQ